METRELMLANRDGKRMPSTLFIPEGKTMGTAVLLHGLGGWKDQPILQAVSRALCADGYATFAFDDSNGVLSPDGRFFDSTQTKYERDIEDGIAYVRSAPWYRPPLILVGHSMGGLGAIDYAAAHPDVDRVIALAPAISWKSMWYSQLPLALIALIRGHESVLGVDGKNFVLGAGWWRDFFSYDGNRSASSVKAKALIISAEKDYTVAKASEHRHLTRRFPRAEHSTISWADHDFDGHEDEVVATIRQWLTSS